MLRALVPLLCVAPLTAVDTAPPTVTAVTLAPDAGSIVNVPPTAITVRFSEPIDAASLTRTSMQVLAPGADGSFDTGDDELVPITGVSASAADEATLDLTGASLVDGVYRVRLAAAAPGRALDFDGTGELATIPDTVRINPTAALTLEAWFRFDVGGNWNPRMVEREWYNLGTTGTGASRLIGVGYGLESTGTYAAGTWHHAALTVDGGAQIWRLYVDGVLVDTVTGIALPASTIPLRLGRSRNPGFDQYDGVVDEVRMWSVVRTQAEIAEAMAVPLSGAEPGLAGYWRLDEASGQAIVDGTHRGSDGWLGEDATVEMADPTRVATAAPLTGVRDAAGNVLDGEVAGAAAASLPSGNGAAGGDALIAFRIDRVAPTLAVGAFVATGSAPVTAQVSGTAADDVALASVRWTLVGATTRGGTATGTTAWAIDLGSVADSPALTILAEDVAGNQTTAYYGAIPMLGFSFTPIPGAGADEDGTQNFFCGSGVGAAAFILSFAAVRRRRR